VANSISTFPGDSVVLIESPDPQQPGFYLQGSGVVIGPHTILTASHVLFDITEQEAVQNTQIYLGWDSADPALGPGNIPTTYTDHYFQLGSVGSDELTQAESATDYAIIDTSYTFSNWMSPLPNYQGGVVNVTGYPATAGGLQTTQTGSVSADPFSSVLDYDTLSVSPGNSGGPLWVDDNGSDDVVGVVSTTGWAVQLTSADLNQIESWVSEDGYSLIAPPTVATPPVTPPPPPPPRIAPTLAAIASVSLAEGLSIPAASLIASIANPSGDAIEEMFEDLGGGNGYFTVDGVRQPNNVWIDAQPSEIVDYVAGTTPGTDTLSVGLHDLTTNTDVVASASVSVATAAPGPDTGAVLWQSADGQPAIWELNGATINRTGLIDADPGPNWKAVGTGDFNDDGLRDILMQNTNGTVAVWEMNGANLLTSGIVADPGPNWTIVGTGDFNGDDDSDIVLQNANSSVAVWEMDGTSLKASAVVANPGQNWKVVGTGDFAGDGQSDILMQNANGSVQILEMNGSRLAGSAMVADPGANWKVAGTGDFNGDGQSDILLQNVNGSVAIWDMDGTSLTNSVVVADPGPNWHAVGTNGGADVLFQNANGQAAVWDISGNSIASGGVAGPDPGPNWRAFGLT
jgi:V8-like Glu-specific endopeptidase